VHHWIINDKFRPVGRSLGGESEVNSWQQFPQTSRRTHDDIGCGIERRTVGRRTSVASPASVKLSGIWLVFPSRRTRANESIRPWRGSRSAPGRTSG